MSVPSFKPDEAHRIVLGMLTWVKRIQQMPLMIWWTHKAAESVSVGEFYTGCRPPMEIRLRQVNYFDKLHCGPKKTSVQPEGEIGWKRKYILALYSDQHMWQRNNFDWLVLKSMSNPCQLRELFDTNFCSKVQITKLRFQETKRSSIVEEIFQQFIEDNKC